jgi:hypothetical protein
MNVKSQAVHVHPKSLMKNILSSLGHYLLLLYVVVLHAPFAFAEDLPQVTPNAYTCAPDHCNICRFTVVGIAPLITSLPTGGCTEVGCSLRPGAPETPVIEALYQKCAKDWRYSKDIRFDELSDDENACVNGVRNHNYWEKDYRREEFDNTYAHAQCLKHHHRIDEKRYSKRVAALCQEGWKDFMLSEEEIARRHAELSAAYAYHSCKNYLKDLEGAFGFSASEMSVLARYIASRRFPSFENHQPETIVSGKKQKDVDILKNIFENLLAKKWVNHALVVTPLMVDTFMRDYKEKIHK